MRGRLTIAFPTPEFVTEHHYGGLATYLFKTTKYLNKIGHNSVIFLLSKQNKSTIHEGVKLIYVKHKMSLGFWMLNSCTLFCLNTTLTTLSKSLALKRAISNYNLREKISLIQYSNAQFLSITTPKKIKHCLRLSQFYYEYSKYIYEKPRSFKNIQKIFLERICIRKAQHSIYGPSKLIAEMVEKEIGITVPVIRTPLFKGTKNSLELIENKNPKYLLYFGTLSRSKGVDLIAHIIHNVLNTYPDIHFKFVGRNTNVAIKDDTILSRLNGLLPKIKNSESSTFVDLLISSSLNHANRVEYIPLVEPNTMQEFIKGAYAVVLPSRIDNFPNTLSESLSHGKIVIVADNSSLDEIIINNRSGFVFTNGSHQSLLEAITKVMELPENELVAISNQALIASKSIEPLKVIEKDLINFYSRIIN